MIAGLVLAAGESSRMGTDKALLTYHGRTFLEIILATLRKASISRIAVVLGHHADEVQRRINFQGVAVVLNQDYSRGQTSSLQAGLKALESPDLDAFVLCLVDQPAVSVEVVQRLIAAFRESGSPVVIPTYQNQRGHPVLIGRALFEELKSLSHDRGANTVVHEYRGATRFVPVSDPGILLDVDDPDAYRRLTDGHRGPFSRRLPSRP